MPKNRFGRYPDPKQLKALHRHTLEVGKPHLTEEIMGPGRDRMARATFAAILAAQKGGCDCESCKILRSAGDVLIQEFGAVAPGRIRKVK